MNDWMLVGKIVKSQGVKGEVKLELNTDNAENLLNHKQLKIADLVCDVESIKCLVNGVFVKFKGIDDRNSADTLKGKNIFVLKANQPKLPKGRYYIVDLIGCKILVNGVQRGVLEDIIQNGAADVYVVKGSDNHNSFMFPALKSVLKNVDVDNKIIELDAEKLKEIAVYED